MVEVSSFISGVLHFLKTDLEANITDPKSLTRTAKSKFIATSYPKNEVIYPMITLKVVGRDSARAGMQTTAMDVTVQIEVRVWALNQKDKDTITDQVYARLRNVQFQTDGSIDNDLHDFAELSNVEVEEDGELGVKSRVMTIQYSFFNVN